MAHEPLLLAVQRRGFGLFQWFSRRWAPELRALIAGVHQEFPAPQGPRVGSLCLPPGICPAEPELLRCPPLSAVTAVSPSHSAWPSAAWRWPRSRRRADPALYALNKNGTLTLNATLLDSLPGSKWVSLVVDGSDRYALRDDGLVFKNGVKLYKLVCKSPGGDDVNEGDWVGITFSNGSLWALSEFGYMAQDGTCVVQLDVGDFEMSTIWSGSSGIYSMRTDGTVYHDTTITPAYIWDAGPGVDGDAEGAVANTEWLAGTVGPDGKAYALRRDGKIIRGDLFVGRRPPRPARSSPRCPSSRLPRTVYSDMAFTEDGFWNVLRLDGEVYKDPNSITPLIEFNDSGANFVDLLPLPASKSSGTTDASFFALRSDGDLFRETGTASVFDLMKSGYGELALSLDPPNLDNIKNSLPVVTKYTVQATTGEAVSFPILATDTDLASDSLVVTLDETTLPEGAVYDDVARTVSWDAPVLGSYKIKVEVVRRRRQPGQGDLLDQGQGPRHEPRQEPRAAGEQDQERAGPRGHRAGPAHPRHRPGRRHHHDQRGRHRGALHAGRHLRPGHQRLHLVRSGAGPHRHLQGAVPGERRTKTVKLTVQIKIVSSLLGF